MLAGAEAPDGELPCAGLIAPLTSEPNAGSRATAGAGDRDSSSATAPKGPVLPVLSGHRSSRSQCVARAAKCLPIDLTQQRSMRVPTEGSKLLLARNQ